MKHIVVGTSGHVDHGKSTLVKALTGVDPDRFEAEKTRGITIDLGFAHYRWQNSYEISFIDVPGHESFIHNLLAGIGGVQIIILVVAADSGVMPQTEEHFVISKLLGAEVGCVVITRCDLADEEMIDLVEEEVGELVKSSYLEDQPVIRCSAQSGRGLEQLKEVLGDLAANLREPNLELPFRLPIDRSFSVKGFGTVVTGTVLAGKIKEDAELLLYPTQETLKIRGFQVHSKTCAEIFKGQRAAINLTGIHKGEILRGYQIAQKDELVLTKTIDIIFELVSGEKSVAEGKTRVKFYCNAQETEGKLVVYGQTNSNLPQRQHLGQLRFNTPIWCRYGDRFILRNASLTATIAGGKIVAPLGNRDRKNRAGIIAILTALNSEDQTERIRNSITLSGTHGVEFSQLGKLTGLSQKILTKELQKLSSQGVVVQINPKNKKYLSKNHCFRIGAYFAKVLKVFHEKFPDKRGAKNSDFFGKISRYYSKEEINFLLNWSCKQDIIQNTDDYYKLAEHVGGLTVAQEQLKEMIISSLKKHKFQPPGLVNLALQLNVEITLLEQLLKIGHRERWIVRVKDDLWYHPEILNQIKHLLITWFKTNQQLTVIIFKELLGVSRKHAVGLLEYFDSLHLTRRQDNYRVLRLEISEKSS